MRSKIVILLFPLMLLLNLTGNTEPLEKKNNLTLEEAITIAINNNTLITQAIEQKKAAIETMKSAKADFFPKASYSYNYTRLQTVPTASFGGAATPVGSDRNATMDFTLTQPLFTGFALLTTYKIAKIDIDISEIAREQAILDVVKQVKIAYYNILLAKKSVNVADEAVVQLQAHERDAEAFFKQGVIPYNDLLKSKVALANAIQAKVKAESDLETAVSSFNTLLRFNINQKVEILDISAITTSTLTLENLISEADQNRPELKSLDLQLKSAEKQITLAKSTYYPEINLVGNYERTGQDWAADENEFGLEHNSSIALTLNWTFFEWGKKSAEVRKTRYQKSALEEQIKGVADSVRLEVKSNWLNINVAEKNIQTASEAVVQAKENYRITNLQYQQQVATSTDVLDAQTFLTQTETNYYNALYGYMTAMAELERSVGGKSANVSKQMFKDSENNKNKR